MKLFFLVLMLSVFCSRAQSPAVSISGDTLLIKADSLEQCAPVIVVIGGRLKYKVVKMPGVYRVLYFGRKEKGRKGKGQE